MNRIARPAGLASGRPAAVYALAAFGVHVAYAPLLSLLLPRRIVVLAPDRAAAITSLVMLAGAITASLAHIGAGRISDRWRRSHGNRRVPIAVGLGLTVLALALLGQARTIGTVAAGLVAFQIALNLLFAPIGAVLVDHFADHAKGRVAALVHLAMPLAATGTGAVALLFPRDGAAPFVAVAALVGLAVLPLVAIWPFARAGNLRVVDDPGQSVATVGAGWPDWARVGLARLLMQSGAAFMMTYFYLFLVRHPLRIGVGPGQPVDPVFGRLVLATTVAVLIATVVAGHWSDRAGRRRAPMMVAALTAALGLALLRAGSGWALMAGYGLFQVGLIAYLALDTALVAQLLGRSGRPGEMLGYLNLANTLPSIVVPSLVLALSRGSADAIWAPGFVGSALCCVVAAGLISRVRAVE